MEKESVTLDEIRSTWPPTVSVPQAARAAGYADSTLYAAIARGECPFQTIRLGGGKTRVITASLVRVLSGEPELQVA